MGTWRDRDKDTKLDECGADGCENKGVARVKIGNGEAYALGAYTPEVRVIVCDRHLEGAIHDKAVFDAGYWLRINYGEKWDETDDGGDARWDEAFAAIGYHPEE